MPAVMNTQQHQTCCSQFAVGLRMDSFFGFRGWSVHICDVEYVCTLSVIYAHVLDLAEACSRWIVCR